MKEAEAYGQVSVWSIWAENRQVARNPHNYQSRENIFLEEEYNSFEDWAAFPFFSPPCLLGRSSYIQFSTALVFGPTAPLNPPWEDVSLCLNVLGSHVSLSCPSTYSGKLKGLTGLLYWEQYLSWLLRQLVLHALEFCGSVISSSKVFFVQWKWHSHL